MKLMIKEFAKVSSGSTPLRSKHKEFFEGGKIPWVKTMDLTNGPIVQTDECITELAAESCKPYPSNTVLVAMYGGFNQIGRTGILQFDAAINQAISGIEVDPEICFPKYLIQYLNHYVYMWQRFAASSRKDPNITSADVRDFQVKLPPLPEQKAIADLLSTWDEAIEKTERLIQAKEKQLDAYGRKLFSRKNEMKYSGWEQVTLKDALTEHEDKSTGQEEVYSVSVHKGLINQVEHLGRSFSAANTDHYNKVHYGDIVYTKSPTGDFPLGIVKQSHTKEDVIVSPLYGVFTPTCFSLGVVIDFYFSSPRRAKNYLFPIIQKGAKNTIAITNKTFLSKKLYLPLEEEAQKVVSEYISTSKKEIHLLKELAEKYKTQKRGLMQKMLTGEWRMKPEIINQYTEA